jgi:hypothetical protein
MNRFNRVSILSLLVFALTSLVVEARIFDNITQQMRFIFFNLSGTQAFSVWLKFAFFVIIFAVLYNGGIKAMKAEKGPMKNAMAVIAFVVGLTSAIFVPSKLLMYIFRLYSAVLVVLFAMLPVGVGFAINQTLFKEDSRMNRILRAVVYFLITVFIFGVIGAVDTMAGPEKALYEQILEPLTYGAIIAFVVGIINLLMALGGDKVVDAVKEKITGKPAAPAAGGGGGTPPTPPTPPGPTPPARNEAEITRLQTEIETFVRAVGNPSHPGPPPVLAAGMWTVLETARARYNAEIVGAPDDPTRRANAPGHMAMLDGIHGTIETQRDRMGQILGSAQYVHVAEPYQQAFEEHIISLLQAEMQFTATYYNTLRWT